MTAAIDVDHVWKWYRTGEFGARSLLDDVRRTVARADRPESAGVWALRDVALSVPQGRVVGVIGRNGSGKSTLLKVLSRVTTPTRGRVRTRGTIASLLEVGTGFHPELTGRENIFLSGAIMGMRRREIEMELDDIVEFSGCGAAIDTPVKRYSSGMTVRLGFAVAAHLRAETMIVDEVLAVGDFTFQTAAVAKMRAVAEDEGRTILFVSHNMALVRDLCDEGVVLDAGRAHHHATVDGAIGAYVAVEGPDSLHRTYEPAPDRPSITRIELDADALARSRLVVHLDVASPTPFVPAPGLVVLSEAGVPLLGSNSRMHVPAVPFPELRTGRITCALPDLPLHRDRYLLSVWLGDREVDHDARELALGFDFVPDRVYTARPASEVIGHLDARGSWSAEVGQ